MSDIYNPEIDSIASLIYWNSLADKEEIKKEIERLKNKGLIRNETTRDYASAWGGPCWYIP